MPRRIHPFLKLLGARIKNRRDELGFSQERLGAEADLDRTYIGGIERGERNPTALALLRIARVLGMTLAELMDEKKHGREETLTRRLQ